MTNEEAKRYVTLVWEEMTNSKSFPDALKLSSIINNDIVIVTLLYAILERLPEKNDK